MNAWMNFLPQGGNANGGYQQNAYSGSNTPTNTYSSSSGNGQDFMQMWQNWPQMMQNFFPFGQANAGTGNNNYGGVQKAATYSSGGASNGKSSIEIVNDSIAQICNQMVQAGSAFPNVGMEQACDYINKVSQQVGSGLRGFVQI